MVKEFSTKFVKNVFKFKFSIKKFIFLCISAGILYYAFEYVGFAEMFKEIDKLNLTFLIPVIALSVGAILLDTYKHKILTNRFDKKIKYTTLIPIYLVGRLFNALTPGAQNGGEFVKSFYLTKLSSKINYYRGLAISLIAGLIFYLVYGPLAIISLIGIMLLGNLSSSLATFLFVLLLILLFGSIILLSIHKYRNTAAHNPLINIGLKVNYYLTKRRTFDNYDLYKSSAMLNFGKFADAWSGFVGKKRLVAKGMFVQILSLSCEFLKTYIIFVSFNYEINFFTVLIIVTVARLAGYVLMLPGGVGVTEASMIALYNLFGIVPGIAAAVTIIDRATYYLINSYGGGLVAWGWLSIKYHVKPNLKKVVKKD